MIADALTKLATASVFEVLHAAMGGHIPAVPPRTVEVSWSGSPVTASSKPAVEQQGEEGG